MSVTAVLVEPGSVQTASGISSATPAIAGIDDEYVMTDEGPVSVAVLWRKLFGAVIDGSSATLVCPSWWSDRRIATVSDAARSVVADVAVERRAALIASVSAHRPAAVFEIAEAFVGLTRPPEERPVRVVSRDDHPHAVADQVASLITGRGLVVIDRPDGVAGAPELSALIADRLRARRIRVIAVGDDRLLRAVESRASSAEASRPHDDKAATPRWARTVAAGVAAAGVLGVAVVAAAEPRTSVRPTTLLVEGRVVVEVPAAWSARRITAGPGSARVQVTSPTDPQAAVHITQSPVPEDETLQQTADTLRRALLDQPPGVFADFNADDRRSGRPAVTYREVREGHDIRWTAFLDGSVRISIGCQSARGSENAVRVVCERAVTSARAIGELAGTVAAQPQSNSA
jgi:type VII secretion-associated protein (TIGR03931 family)